MLLENVLDTLEIEQKYVECFSIYEQVSKVGCKSILPD